MSNEMMKNWSEYKPTKAVWLWSCVGTAALTVIVGFTGAGWVTSGTAAEWTHVSTEQAVATLAAGICANRFLGAEAKLAALKDMDSWKRSTFIKEGGWVTFASMKEPVDGAAELCANQLATAELPVLESGA